MKVIHVRNVHEALPVGLDLLTQHGIRRESRNGPVLVAPTPVTTVYARPWERVMFWSARDANPFFHLYEALWMLAGRNDVAGPARYAKQMLAYSDDGEELHGAYGYRWRKQFLGASSKIEHADQLADIAKSLRENPADRRCVLQMWDAVLDLNRDGKDLPCNLTATFQRDIEGKLHLTVFNRSNDIIWGAYGANAVHFSFLLEYMALAIGCEMGTYTQVSVNYHAYLDQFEKVQALAGHIPPWENPYDFYLPIGQQVFGVPMRGDGDIREVDLLIEALLHEADHGFPTSACPETTWAATVYYVLAAHHTYKEDGAWDALAVLDDAPVQDADWVVAAREWLMRRQAKQEAR